MRKLILSMQTSLDGFIEGENGAMSWFEKDDPEQWQDLFEMWQSVDLFVLGRVMYPDYRDYWKSTLANEKAPPNHQTMRGLPIKTAHIVFRSLKDAGWGNTRIISGAVVEEVKIKEQPGKHTDCWRSQTCSNFNKCRPG